MDVGTVVKMPKYGANKDKNERWITIRWFHRRGRAEDKKNQKNFSQTRESHYEPFYKSSRSATRCSTLHKEMVSV
jgi:hypothetical protein